MRSSTLSKAALAAAAFATSSFAHTWVEEMRIIGPDGTFTNDPPGYPRSFAKRLPGVDPDKAMVHILPPDGTPITVGITPNDVMCMPSQQNPVQSGDSPRLKAAAGDMVALRYQENGHVTLPDINPGKPLNRGTVYVYGTTQPSDTEKFLDVHKNWTADGNGGNKNGKLLTTQNYDDGQCYQMNGGQISQQRQKEFPHQADPLMGQDLWCQTDLKIPQDAPNGKPYTLYWVWDWSDVPGKDPTLPNGKAQFYTTCMDVDITGTQAAKSNSKAAAAMKITQGQSLNEAAIPVIVSQLAAGKVNMANPSATAGSPGSVGQAKPVSSTPAPVASQQPGAAQQPQLAATQAPSMTTITVSAKPLTIYKTVTANAQSTSTSQITVPKSTAQVTISSNAAPQGIPTISLKSFAGTASNVAPQATGNAGYKRAGSAKFRNG